MSTWRDMSFHYKAFTPDPPVTLPIWWPVEYLCDLHCKENLGHYKETCYTWKGFFFFIHFNFYIVMLRVFHCAFGMEFVHRNWTKFTVLNKHDLHMLGRWPCPALWHHNTNSLYLKVKSSNQWQFRTLIKSTKFTSVQLQAVQ